MRKIIIAGNWKMNKGLSDTREFVKELVDTISSLELKHTIPLIAPAYPFLQEALRESFGSAVQIAAQNVSLHSDGAFTGEVSATMLASLGLKYGIIGHSERRQYHEETDSDVLGKMHKLFEQKITPILCIGETLAQRDANQTAATILSQLKGCLHGVEMHSGNEIVIAYEPVWAIGTGRTATPEQAQEVHALIRKWLRDNYPSAVAENMAILYGGSVKPDNLKSLLACEDIDGGLIGGASLKVDDFVAMVKIANDSLA
ncbi:MAG: triose-phosphate isomerase [Candidatus Cloacimonetes bacterium]|nr:triose-phosphate isomerase [Candidatus Cloacimonadota bacterium]MDD3235476.1 triose-phosphate isomerase [Candidatus Cloacimonadota bacterium]